MTIGQLIKNTETGRLGIIKSFLSGDKAVVIRCGELGMPKPDIYHSSMWGSCNGPGIWITPLNKWEPVITPAKSVIQMSLFA